MQVLVVANFLSRVGTFSGIVEHLLCVTAHPQVFGTCTHGHLHTWALAQMGTCMHGHLCAWALAQDNMVSSAYDVDQINQTSLYCKSHKESKGTLNA